MKATMTNVTTLLFFTLLVLAGAAGASTPDGQTPSVETVCDQYKGAAYGLCNAYCEAMDCHCYDEVGCEPSASQNACNKIAAKFEKKVGSPLTSCGPVDPPAEDPPAEDPPAEDPPAPADCPCDGVPTSLAWSDDPYDTGFSFAGALWDTFALGGFSSVYGSCTSNGTVEIVENRTEVGSVVTVGVTDTQCYASDNLGTSGFLSLETEAEADACRELLLAVSAAAGLSCG